MSAGGQQLFDFLPALYRLRDAELAQAMNPLSPAEKTKLQSLLDKQAADPKSLTPTDQSTLTTLLRKTRGPLQSLLMLIAEQLAIVANDLDQLYDDQFIETCAPWVIPYIGDLIGYRAVKGAAPSVASPRAEVAHTISFRRRKGTILMLEQLARDVTGWGARAVEMFKVLADTQYMNHIRLFNFYAPDLRHWQVGAYMSTGFDRTAHKVDVRRIAVERGRYNIQNVAIFLWSLNAYSLGRPDKTKQIPLTPVDAQSFRFSPLGCDMPLFNHPVPLSHSDITGPAEPFNVPDRLSRRLLCEDIQRRTPIYWGDSLVLSINGKSVDIVWVNDKRVDTIRVCDLSGPDGRWNNMPGPNGLPAIDPQLGRLAVPPLAGGSSNSATASFYYGFNADIGGGQYPRQATFSSPPQQPLVRLSGGDASPQRIQQALNSLNGDGAVEIADSSIYHLQDGLNIQVKSNGRIQLRAADECRPTLLLRKPISVSGGANSEVDLNGLLIGYDNSSAAISDPAALVYASPDKANELGTLNLTHCTVVPGWALDTGGLPLPSFAGLPTLRADTPGLQVLIKQSIVGTLYVNLEASASLTDSIVDAACILSPSKAPDISGVAYVASIDASGPHPGGALTMSGCTVVGKIYASLLSLVTDCIIWAERSAAGKAATPPLWKAALWTDRKQQGCVRFSYVPADCVMPRHFQCVPLDVAQAAPCPKHKHRRIRLQAPNTPQPLFCSLRYGDPAYCKLWPFTDDAIRRGAEDGGEMGAFHFVQAPSREIDLRVRMQEYLPVGLEFGVFYEN